MKILITGGAGFIGRHVIDALSYHGLAGDLVVLDSFEEVVHGPGPYPSTIKGFSRDDATARVIHGNICDPDAVHYALAGAQVVIHLAAAVSVSSSFEHPARFIRDNDFGTAALWQGIRQHPLVRHVINASSMSVYGHGPEHVGVLETAPTNPLNLYALSKLNAERISILLGELYDVPVTNLRFFNVYGPGQALNNSETGVVAIWTAAMLHGKDVVIYEDGLQLRDMVFVTDVAEAIARVTDSGRRLTPMTINIGTGKPVPVIRVADMIANRLNVPRCQPTGRMRVGDSRHCWADVEKMWRVLGYTAQVGIDAGLSETVRWAKAEFAATP